MAAMALDPPARGPASGAPAAPARPSRNPMPLSASQEAQVRDVFYARVRKHCEPEIKAFADCALGRTFTAPFVCRSHLRAMNGCMKDHATPAEHDAAREEWFAGKHERARERLAKAKRAEEQEKFHREWWGLPDKEEGEKGIGKGKAKGAGEPGPGRRREDGK